MDQIRNLYTLFVVYAALALYPQHALAQVHDAGLPDSPSESQLQRHRNDPGAERQVSWRSLPKDFLHDQKEIWTFPIQLGNGRHWAPTLAISAVTAGLIFADPHAMPYFESHARNLDDINDVFDPLITTGEVIALPLSLMVAGYARHDTYQVSTALLAVEAYADSAVVDLGIKAVTRRKRPSDVLPGGSYHDTFFAGGKSPFKGSSFPSGHAASVFSVATVVASRSVLARTGSPRWPVASVQDRPPGALASASLHTGRVYLSISVDPSACSGPPITVVADG